VVAGHRLRQDGIDLEVLGPRAPARAPWSVRNDDSVVLALRQGGVTLLLAGDVEAAGEAALRAPRSLVLKVPHHGSRTSSGEAFVRQVAPRFALVSAGFRNHFGHPHPEVEARYRQHRAVLARTDLDGTLEVTTDGSLVEVASASGWRARATAPKSH
jgi:competence protein ComEC